MSAIFDWLGREGGVVLAWWLLSLLAGIAVWPLFFRLMGGLPSRGYALARAGGLILSGYLFWILNILGLFRNDAGNAALCALIVFAIGVIGYLTWRNREPMLPWLRAHWRLILSAELLFAVAFFSWAIVRAFNPSLLATEKPMEIAFLSSSRRSLSFPPIDPWMSGYAISYYHFGYIIMGALGNLSNATIGENFNLTAALLFGLTCVGAYGVGWDLVAARRRERLSVPEELGDADPVTVNRKGQWTPYAAGLVAAIMLAVMGNLNTALVEAPYQYGIAPASYLSFMDIRQRNTVADPSCMPGGQLPPACFWWWWPSSRVVNDRNLVNASNPADGASFTSNEIIDEEPTFSFILSDIHPHVLSLPFILLAVGLSLNLVLLKRAPHPWEFLIYAICVGGLVFLNSWDIVFLSLLIGAEALRRLLRNGTGWLTGRDWGGVAGFAGLAALATGVLYLPFLISFRSQAGGLMPNIIWPTRFQEFFVMFGPFLVILGAFVIVERWRAQRSGRTFNAPLAAQMVIYLIIILAIALVVMGLLAWSRDDLRGTLFKGLDTTNGTVAAILTLLSRRTWGLLTEGVLLALLFGIIGRLFAKAPPIEAVTLNHSPEGEELAEAGHSDVPSSAGEGLGLSASPSRRVITYSASTGFTLLLIAIGTIAALAPEFVILRDNFGDRINTVFKLYYQAWIMWSVAGSYALWSMLGELAIPTIRVPRPARLAIGIASVVLILAGSIYTPLAVYSRAVVDGGHTDPNRQVALTLDSANSLAVGQDDYNAIDCLNKLVKGDQAVVAEGMHDNVAYDNTFGRVSALSGIPTLIGWSNHENQWRGDTYPAIRGSRIEDEQLLYATTDWASAQTVIKKYRITYVYVGPTEQQMYNAGGGLAKFDSLIPVCKSGTAAVYATAAMPQTSIADSAVSAPNTTAP